MDANTPWEQSEIDELIALRKDGKTNGEIGDALSRSRYAIERMLAKLKREGMEFPKRVVIPKQDDPSPWTAESVETLRKLAAESNSASQIAEALGEPFTRASVLGKAHRLGIGLSGHLDYKARKPPRRRSRVHMPVVEAPPCTDGVTLEAVLEAGGCKWPVSPNGVPRDGHRFCGEAKAGSQVPYCFYHLRKAIDAKRSREAA